MDLKVSVLMPTRNNDEFIEKAITTTLDQTYKNIELIVGNDGSTDKTEEIIKSFDDDRIKYVWFDSINSSLGTAYITNRCFEQSTGDIIAYIDSDDWQELDRIEKCVDTLINNNYDIVSCKAVRCINKYQKRKETFGMVPYKYLRNIRGGNAPICPSRVCWRGVVDLVGPLREDLTRGSDGLWNVKSLMLGMVWGFVDEFLYYYRFHDNQVTKEYDMKEYKNNIVEKWSNGEYIMHLL